MPFPKTGCFLAGLLIGVAGFFVFAMSNSAPLESQVITKIPVRLGNLKPEHQWLKDVRFEVVPLDGVKSKNKYAIIIVEPPPMGIHGPKGAAANLDLVESDLIQPFEIRSEDFGADGNEVIVKFIDESSFSQHYPPSSKNLMINSDYSQ